MVALSGSDGGGGVGARAVPSCIAFFIASWNSSNFWSRICCVRCALYHGLRTYGSASSSARSCAPGARPNNSSFMPVGFLIQRFMMRSVSESSDTSLLLQYLQSILCFLQSETFDRCRPFVISKGGYV